MKLVINVFSHHQYSGYENAGCHDNQDWSHLTQSHTAENDGVTSRFILDVPLPDCSQHSVPKKLVQAEKWFM
jgi:hypothetical protein